MISDECRKYPGGRSERATYFWDAEKVADTTFSRSHRVQLIPQTIMVLLLSRNCFSRTTISCLMGENCISYPCRNATLLSNKRDRKYREMWIDEIE